MAINRNSVPRRHTGPLVTDKEALADLETANGIRQFDQVRRLASERPLALNLTPADVCELNRLAIAGIYETAGQFRDCEIHIGNTNHQPPPPAEVPGLVTEMCEYVGTIADQAILASSYLMWRINWIHPFPEGNGRTSRAVSYLALCCGFGMDLPGLVTVPDLIVRERELYYHALDTADAAWKDNRVDVSEMHQLIETLLTEQLSSM